MSLRPRLTGPEKDTLAVGRMAPGGRMFSESPIPRQAQRRVRRIGAPPKVLPQFWWKFDEASGAFHDSVADAGNIGSASGYHQTPLAPDSTYSMRTGSMVEGWDFPAVTPGPTGWIVFDWWMAYQDQTLTGSPVRVMLTRFRSAAGTSNDLRVLWTAMSPDLMTKKLRFLINGSSTLNDANVEAATVLALTAWDDPGHFVWKVKPTTGEWKVYIGGALVGSGSASISWSGLWEARFVSLKSTPASGWDEFKVYGE